MIPYMPAYRMAPLAGLMLSLAPTVFTSRAQSGTATGTPAAVVDSFFHASEHERWRDAARLMDLEAFAELRDQTVRFMRQPRNVPRLTPQELIKHDPKMPRVVAEYEAARSNEAMSRYNGVSLEYANVSSVDSLAALPVEEAAARWLEARDPRYHMRRSLEEVRSRCDLPDSVVSRVLLAAPSTTARVLGTVLEDSIAYVLYAEQPVERGGADSVAAGARGRRSAHRATMVMPPPVLTLRRLGSRWRIAPGEPFGGWSGYMSVTDCPATGSGKSSPRRSP
jgi:hypothetical protein